MARPKFRFFPAALLLLAGAAAAADLAPIRPERAGMSAERLDRLNAALREYVDDGRLAGQAALVLRGGRVVFSAVHGMRDVEAGLPMTEDTIFRIASQTKAVVSVGIMILHERGRLDISHPLGRYLPEWRETTVAAPDGEGGYATEPARRPITIRDLLTHTAGIGYGGGPARAEWAAAELQGWYFAGRSEPIGESVARMAALPMDDHPGERWVYGYGTDILGALIEKVDGRSLDVFLEAEILEPLGMEDTHFYLPESKRDRLAVVYRPRPGGGVEAIPARDGMRSQGLYADGPRVSFSGGAGLLSTAGDYARFLQMTLNGGELDGARILSRKSVELMTADHLGDIPFRPGQGFGLGFSVVTDLGDRGALGSEGEYGWGGAYHSIYWVDPAEELVVVYLTQLIPAGDIDDHDKLRSGVYQAIID